MWDPSRDESSAGWLHALPAAVYARAPGARAYARVSLTPDGGGAAAGASFCLLRRARLEAGVLWVEATLRYTGEAPLELARVHVLEAEACVQGLHFVCEGVARPLDQPVEAVAEAEARGWARAHARFFASDDPLPQESNWLLSRDMGYFLAEETDTALVIGFCGARKAFGQVGARTLCKEAAPLFAGYLLDDITIAPGAEIPLDAMVLFRADRASAVRLWADCNALCNPPRHAAAPRGYCSWYQKESAVTQGDFEEAIDQYADLSAACGQPLLVQLDDGYQRAPFDWSPNEKFPDLWALPERIAQKGNIPGIWIAPTAILCNDPLIARYPDIIQRERWTGTPFALSNWWWCHPDVPRKYNTYFLNPDHPVARERMAAQIRTLVAHGFRYLKIDFVQNLFGNRRRIDPDKTTFESLRDLFALFRDAAGEAVTICACVGSLARYAAGLADTLRVGGDIGATFEQLRANLPDFVRKARVGRAFAVVDPDVYFMRRDASRMTLEESFLLTGVIGMLGGAFLTSDLPGQWDEAARARVSFFLCGPQDAPQDISLEEDAVQRVRALVCRHAAYTRVGFINWDDSPADMDTGGLPLEGASIRQVFPADVHARVAGSTLTVAAVPPHALRIVEIRLPDAEESIDNQ